MQDSNGGIHTQYTYQSTPEIVGSINTETTVLVAIANPATPSSTSTTTSSPSPTPASTAFSGDSTGISLHSLSQNDAQLTVNSEAKWIRIDVDSNFKNAVAIAHSNGLKVLGILGSWMFGKATTFSTEDWIGNVTYYISQNPKVDAWEIWNEPTLTDYPLMTANASGNIQQTAQNYYWMV